MDNFELTQDYKNLRNKILDYLASRDYSVKKLTQKIEFLKKRFPKSKRYLNYTPENTAYVINKLVRLGVIDEERSLHSILNSSTSGIYGLRRLKQKMVLRGYDRKLIDKVIKEFEEAKIKRDLSRIIELTKTKKARLEARYFGDAKKLYSIKSRLYNFLASRGFSSEEIGKIISAIK